VTRFGLYAGGFLGPFGGAIIAVLIPQLRDAFDASTAAVTWGITAYLIPFAALQLVSGTIGERLGIARTVRTGYVAYAGLSLLAAFAPSIEVFIAARALQGAANAFLTPLLLAALAESTAPGGVGRAVGTFAAVQTAALVASPLIGGLAGELTWRLAFLAPAVAALALAGTVSSLRLSPPADASRRLALPGARDAHAEPPRLRTALTRRVGWLSAAAYLGYLCIAGMGFLVALRAADAFGLGSTERGLLVASFGLSGVLVGRAAGGFADRRGRVTAALLGAVVCAVTVPLLGVAGSPETLALAWLAAGAGSAFVWAGVNTMAVEAVPGNRAGATSVISAFKFAGNALAPLVWLPLYTARPASAFLAAGVGSLALGAAVVRVRSLTPEPARYAAP
jgi:MFS family permease